MDNEQVAKDRKYRVSFTFEIVVYAVDKFQAISIVSDAVGGMKPEEFRIKAEEVNEKEQS